MATSTLWKLAAFWIVFLVAMSFAVAFVPGGEKFPQLAMVAVILAIAIVQLLYIKRTQPPA